jgi:hypothetical protein
MKKICLLLCFLLLTSCTQQSVIKNTALRHTITQFDDELAKYPDSKKALAVREKTRIVVSDVKMISDHEALATVEIRTVNPENLSQSQSREVQVRVVKENGWEVKDAQK